MMMRDVTNDVWAVVIRMWFYMVARIVRRVGTVHGIEIVRGSISVDIRLGYSVISALDLTNTRRFSNSSVRCRKRKRGIMSR